MCFEICGQNFWKIPTRKFIFSKVEGIKPAIFRDEAKEEKNLLKITSEGSEATKQLGGLGGILSPPNGVKSPGVESWKKLDFYDFHVPREAISDMFSS